MESDPIFDEYADPKAVSFHIGNYQLENLVADHFLIKEFNARGQNEAYYLVRIYSDETIEQFPVLKMMIDWEHRVLTACNSPHIIQLMEGLKGDQFLFHFYNKLRFRSVAELVASQGPAPEAIALKWLRQIVEGLVELNRYDYFPRIITPESFRVHDGNAYLDLFGDDRNRFILLGQEPPWYACEAPDIFENRGLRDVLETGQDVWSLGVCLYYMLFGGYPWQQMADLSQFYLSIIQSAGGSLQFPEMQLPITSATQHLLRGMIEPDRSKRMSWEQLVSWLTNGGQPALKAQKFGAPKNLVPDLLYHYETKELSMIKGVHPTQDNFMEQSEEQKDFSVCLKDANQSLFSSLVKGKFENLITRESVNHTDCDENDDSTRLPVVDGIPNRPKQSLIPGMSDQRLQAIRPSLDDGLHASMASVYTNFNENMHNSDSKSRYKHEAKVIYHIIDTLEEIEGMVAILKDLPASGYYNQGFIVMALLLTKTILEKNRRMIDSFQSKQNIFNMPDFQEFVQTEASKPVLKALREDQETYNEMWVKQLVVAGKAEPKTAFLKEIYLQITSPGFEYRVKDELEKWTLRLYGYYLDHSAVFDASMRNGVQHLLAKIFMGVYDETEFEFDRDGKIFNWGMLEVQMDKNYLTETFKIGITNYSKNQSKAKYHSRFFLELNA